MSEAEQPEAVAQLVSSSSAEVAPPETSEEAMNGCDSTTEGAPAESTGCEDLEDTSSMEAEEPRPLSSESQGDAAKTSRELKSILALSKEAKLDTNLSTQRRKTIDKAKVTPKKKVTNFPVTAESELENYEVKYEEKARLAKKRKASLGEVSGDDEAKKTMQNVVGSDFVMPKKPNKDTFCWRCHHDSVQIACETCPRAYHLKCLKQTIMDMEHWPCPECVAILKAENTQTRSKAMKGMSLEHLCSLLKFAVKRMIQCSGSEPFIHPVDETQFPEYRNYIVQPMTLTMLEKNIKDNLYGSTQAFEADAKWLLHNSIVFNSSFPDQSKLTTAAKTIVKICKQEMAEIENCPSCYLNANTKKHTWFVEVCPKPHLLVWAKLKGFPYWPAKVMSINSSGMADVRFFGAHDKAWVSVKDCYLYSVKDPNSGKQKRNDIIECVKELELYVDNLREIYGRVNFAPFKTPLEPNGQMKQLQVFLPNYRNEGKEIMKKVMGKMEGRSLNKSVSNENLNDQSEDKSTESEEEEEDEDEEDDEDVSKKRRKSEESGSGDKSLCHMTKEGSMTRIDYRDSSSDKPKLIAKPIKAILIRKRNSADSTPENVVKIARRDIQKIESTRSSFDSDSKMNESAEMIQDDAKMSPSKLKITDQLIKKLEDLGEEDKGTNKSEESETEGKIENVPETNENVEKTVPDEGPETGEDTSIVEETNEKEEEEKMVDESSKNDIDSKEEIDKTENEEKEEEESEVAHKAEDEKSESVKDTETDLDETNIRNIIHTSLIPTKNDEKEAAKKRKLEEETKDNDEKISEDENLFPPNKMVKLVPIENILQKKTDAVVETANTTADPQTTNSSSKQDQLVLLKEIRTVVSKDGKEVKNKTNNNNNKVEDSEKTKDTSLKIKNEIESDDDDSDVQYMEAKRQYLSALNISEKQKVPVKPKAHEIRTRSKTEEKKSKSIDNLSKVIEDVANRTGGADSPATNKTQSSTNNSETPVKEIYIKSLSRMQTPKHKARKSFPTPNYNTNKKTIVARKIVPKISGNTDDELTIVNAATLQSTGNVMILPKLHYNKPIQINRELSSPPVLTMLPRTTTATDSSTSTTKKSSAEGSQNYIPQNEDSSSGGRNAAGGILLNNLLSGSSGTNTPPVIDVDAQNGTEAELGILKDILPDNVSKGVGDLLCQPPPKLKPKPMGILNNVAETGVPSTAGPVATRINAMAQKLNDYFRGLLVETISELGKSNNPEATISSLKYEIEELNHKHSIELAEIRRNVSIVLKDIQKSVVEERERIINETKANCEMETLKRVEEAKSKQWCANCSKEAQFYCCWNTSYCDYPCQQKHWVKHMSKCTQTAGQNQTGSTPVRSTGQQIVLTPTSAPKFGALFAKPQKVYLKRTNTPFKQASGSHITLVESTPGNFELLGSGPIAVNGKILASTSVIEKIKSGNIVTVTAPSGPTNTQLTSANQKVNPVSKSTTNSSDSEH